jgi:sarcosine oxidase subunit gamma
MTQRGHYGAAASGVSLSIATIAAAWNVQGDPAHASFTDVVQASFGIALPLAPNTTTRSAAIAALWLGPTSWLLIAGDASAPIDFNARREALNAAGGALFDVTAARVAWTIAGTHAETVLAKGCPLDFHPRAFAAGTCAQSVLWQVDALFVRADDESAFTVMVARSYARDVWHALCESAGQYGYDVLASAPYR